MLKRLIESCPFVVLGIHSDNGSEYINRPVAKLLEQLGVQHFTKSRPRRSNDNALVESKNGSTIRRWFGYGHIPKLFDAEADAFAHQVLSPHLNYHRPCLFPTEIIDDKGRIKRRYRDHDTVTPFQRLKAIPNVESYLKPGIRLEDLESRALRMNGTPCQRDPKPSLRPHPRRCRP